MDQLRMEMIEREGRILHFYCDNRGFVTIGIGHLVDGRGLNRIAAENLARAIGGRVVFSHPGGARATPNQVVEDWRRVKDRHADDLAPMGVRGRIRVYAQTARLRITVDEANRLWRTRIGRDLDRLYGDGRAWLIDLDERIHMALLDVLYNAAGIALYAQHDFWATLNPNLPTCDWDEALRIFRETWRGRGGVNRERYQERHNQRVIHLQAGIEAMRRREAGF